MNWKRVIMGIMGFVAIGLIGSSSIAWLLGLIDTLLFVVFAVCGFLGIALGLLVFSRGRGVVR